MRLTVASLAALCLLAGCALSPPKPPQCQGDFRPVNAAAPQRLGMTMSRMDSVVLCTKGVANAKQG